MAKRKKKTLAEIEYAKQLRRIKQFIRRAEKRGVVFKEDIIPNKPKRITDASVRRLINLTPEKLYKKGSVYSEEKGRYAKLKGRPKRGALKSLDNVSRETLSKTQDVEPQELSSIEDTEQIDFEAERRKKDAEEIERLMNDKEYSDRFNTGEIYYNRIIELIDDAGERNPEGADKLRKLFSDEIEKYGREKVLMAIGNVPDDAIELCEQVLWYHEDADLYNIGALIALREIIEGQVLSLEEIAEMESTIEYKSKYKESYL